MSVCRYDGCLSHPVRRRLCREHLRMTTGPLQLCTVTNCKAVRTVPLTDGFCKDHHPLKKELTTLESAAVGAVARGLDPAQALVDQGLMLNRQTATQFMKKQEEKPAFAAHMERLAKKAGIRPADGFRAIRRALVAKTKKHIAVKDDEGNVVDVKTVDLGDDHRTQLQAADMLQSFVHGKAASRQEINSTSKSAGVVFLVNKDPLPEETPMIFVEDRREDD